MTLASNSSGPITGMSASTGILIGARTAGVVEVSGLRLHQRVVEEAGQAEREHVEHHAEHDLVDQVADREHREQRSPISAAGDHRRRPRRRPRLCATVPTSAPAKAPDQHLALDRHVDHAGALAEHAGQRPEDQRRRRSRWCCCSRPTRSIVVPAAPVVGPAQEGHHEGTATVTSSTQRMRRRGEAAGDLPQPRERRRPGRARSQVSRAGRVDGRDVPPWRRPADSWNVGVAAARRPRARAAARRPGRRRPARMPVTIRRRGETGGLERPRGRRRRAPRSRCSTSALIRSTPSRAGRRRRR